MAGVSARLIAIANALDGMDRASAARLAGMDRQTLRDWVHRYNAEGIAGLCDRPKPGRAPKLTEGQMASLKAIVLAGPDPAADQVGRWRIVDLCRYVEERWDVSYSETGMLRLSMVARPEPPQDPAAPPAERREGPASLQKGGFAACLNEIAEAHPEAQRLEIWSQDEARVGQKGRTGYVWWQRGHTPRGRRDVGYQSAWIIGAVCPARDTGVALVLTRLDTAAMNLFLAELSQAVRPRRAWRGADGQGRLAYRRRSWSCPKTSAWCSCPPCSSGALYSPELNPIERLWLHLRDNRLSHCVFRTTDEIIDSCCAAWNWLLGETGRIRSLCSYPWLAQVSN